MIDSHNSLSISCQCRLLSLNRSVFYYQPQGESTANLQLMEVIDKQFLLTPHYGVKQMTYHLRNEGYRISFKRVKRLMRLMGLKPIYQEPRLC